MDLTHEKLQIIMLIYRQTRVKMMTEKNELKKMKREKRKHLNKPALGTPRTFYSRAQGRTRYVKGGARFMRGEL